MKVSHVLTSERVYLEEKAQALKILPETEYLGLKLSSNCHVLERFSLLWGGRNDCK